MKKFLLITLVAILSISLIGCGGNEEKGEDRINVEETNKMDNETSQANKDKYKAKFGEVIETNNLDNKLTIKFKISPSYNNKATIHQNGFNIEDLILNQGADKFDSIDYWAVSNMTDGSESKVISFTIDKDLINAIKNKNLVGNQIVENAKDVWILPSLRE